MIEGNGQENGDRTAEARPEGEGSLSREALRQKALRQEILRQGLLKSELEYEQARAAGERLERERKRRKIGLGLILLGVGSFAVFFLVLGIFDELIGYVFGVFPMVCIIAGAWVWSWSKPKY